MNASDLQFGTIYVRSNGNIHILMQSLQSVLWSGMVGYDLRGMQLEGVDDANAQVPQLVARRFNIGNMGRAAVVRLDLPQDLNLNKNIRQVRKAVEEFAHVLTDVASPDSGDRTISPDWDEADVCYSIKFEMACESAMPPAAPKALRSKASKRSWSKWSLKKLTKQSEESQFDEDDECGAAPSARAPKQRDTITEQEERELQSIEADRQHALDELRRAVLHYVITCHQDPTHLIEEMIQGKYIIGRDSLSPLLVNGDLEIVLPGYDEARVKMPALCRAIYILFLCHRHDGIVLKEFANYRAELEEIYAIVMPGRDERRAAATINNLCDPLGNTLKEYISKIKKCFAGVLADKHLLDRYVIAGTRGEPYRIHLPDDLVTLPAAITA
ncbi:MAG: hypothetical protein IKR25_05365 [Muribaculaceae bacterium]|nr:hypothetical protein [Muribaculaceae bacterium]